MNNWFMPSNRLRVIWFAVELLSPMVVARFFYHHHLLLIAVLVSGACAPLGPDHQVPEIELPDTFSVGDVTWRIQKAKEASISSNPRWWKMFGDDTLNQLVERTLNHNQDLAAAMARVREAREFSSMARSRFFPAVDMGATAERTQFRFRGPGGGSSISNNFTLPVDLTYEIDLWGKVRREVEAATASEQATSELLQLLKLTLAAETAQTYWALRALDTERAVLARAIDARRKALELLTKQAEYGKISDLDLARAEAELATAESDRIQLEQVRVELVNALAVLCGTVASGSKIAESNGLPPAPLTPTTLSSELLLQRPDIRAAERELAAANARIGVAKAAYFPSLGISASSGFDSALSGNLLDASSLVWSLGANALVPLTSQRYLRSQKRATVAAHEAASAKYRQTVLNAIRDVENALQGKQILERRLLAQNQALDAAEKAYRLSVKRFDQGLVSLLDVIDADRTRLEAERASNAIRGEQLAITVALAKALGGSW